MPSAASSTADSKPQASMFTMLWSVEISDDGDYIASSAIDLKSLSANLRDGETWNSGHPLWTRATRAIWRVKSHFDGLDIHKQVAESQLSEETEEFSREIRTLQIVLEGHLSKGLGRNNLVKWVKREEVFDQITGIDAPVKRGNWSYEITFSPTCTGISRWSAPLKKRHYSLAVSAEGNDTSNASAHAETSSKDPDVSFQATLQRAHKYHRLRSLPASGGSTIPIQYEKGTGSNEDQE